MKKLAGLLLVMQAFSVFANPPVFDLIPLTATNIIVGPGETGTVSYKVINMTPYTLKDNGLHYAPEGQTPVGVTQVPGGAGVCSDPFTLKAGASCQLNLLVTADDLNGNVVKGGPEVCSTKYYPTHCSVPGPNAQLSINIPSLLSLAVGQETSGSQPPFFVETTNIGNTWFLGTLPQDAPSHGAFSGTACNSAMCAITGVNLASNSYYLTYSNDQGNTWLPASITPIPPIGSTFEGISCGSGICVGSMNPPPPNATAPFVVQTLNNGASWEKITPGTDTNYALYQSINCSDLVCVTVGFDVHFPPHHAILAYSQFDGSSWSAWTQLTLNTTGGAPAQAFDVSCSGALCVAVGAYGANALYSVTIDKGTTWVTSQSSLNGSELQSVSCSGTVCVAGGKYNAIGNTSILVQSTNSGSSWSVVNTPSPVVRGNYFDISCTEILCVALGYVDSTYYIWQSTNPGVGMTWSVVSIPGLSTDPQFTQVDCDESFCILTGKNVSADSPLLAQTRDGGQHWTLVTVPDMPQNGVLNGSAARSADMLTQ